MKLTTNSLSLGWWQGIEHVPVSERQLSRYQIWGSRAGAVGVRISIELALIPAHTLHEDLTLGGSTVSRRTSHDPGMRKPSEDTSGGSHKFGSPNGLERCPIGLVHGPSLSPKRALCYSLSACLTIPWPLCWRSHARWSSLSGASLLSQGTALLRKPHVPLSESSMPKSLVAALCLTSVPVLTLSSAVSDRWWQQWRARRSTYYSPGLRWSGAEDRCEPSQGKGTGDFPPEEMRLRSWLFHSFREVRAWPMLCINTSLLRSIRWKMTNLVLSRNCVAAQIDLLPSSLFRA